MTKTPAQQDSFITAATKKIIAQLEEDISKTETSLDSTYQFAPLCWLESSFTNYAADISSYTIIEPNAPYATMLSILRDAMKRFTDIGKPTPQKVKFILVLCKLIQLMPVHKTSPDVNIALTELLTIRFTKSSALGEFQDIINEAIDNVVVLSVEAGSNPIPGLLLVQQDNKNVIGLIHSLNIGNHNVSSYRCILGAIVPFAMALEPGKRNEFCMEFYYALGSFNANHPAQHHEMLQLSVNQAQLIIDTVLGWKSIETEYLPLLCTLLPFCTVALADMASNKKSPYHAILKELGDFKVKKGNFVEGAAFAYLELYAALSHTINFKNKSVFKPIDDFLNKHREKFEKNVFTYKEKYLQSGKLFSDFLPRYAAVEYLTRGEGVATKYLFDQAPNGAGWQPLATFMYLTTSGYPLLNTELKFQDSRYSQMGQKIIESMTYISIDSSEKEKKDDGTTLSTSIAKYLTHGLMGDPIISALTLARGDPAKEWQPSKGLTQFLQCLRDSQLTGSVICSIAQGIVHSTRQLSDELINLLLIIWANRSYWKDFNITDFSKIVLDFSVSFKQTVIEAIKTNSQNLENMPAIFLSFLRLTQNVLVSKGKKVKKGRFTSDVRGNFIYVLQMLRGTCGSSRAYDLCESVCENIFAAYELPPAPKFPYEGIQISDPIVMAGIKFVIESWFCYIKKFSGVAIPAATSQPKFVPSHERISTITDFVCRFVDDSAIITPSGQNLGPTAENFFAALFAYISKIRDIDYRLGNCLQYLHPSSFPFIVKAVEKGVIEPYMKSDNNNQYFWISVCDVCAGIAKNAQITEEVYQLLERVSPIILSNLQFNKFTAKVEYIISCSNFISAMYSHDIKIARNHLRWTTSLLTITDSFLDIIEHEPKNARLLEAIVSMFPVILHGYQFGLCDSSVKTPDIEIERRTSRNMFYVLNSFNTLTKTFLTPTLVNYIYASLLEILAANPGTGWRHFVIIAESVENLMKIIIVEAFTEFLGMKYMIMSKMTAQDIKNIKNVDCVITTTETDKKKAEKELKQKAKELKYITEKLAQYSRSLRNPSNLVFDTTEHKKLVDYLTENDFAFFQNPPTQNPHVLASAVRVCAAANQLHALFKRMTELFIQNGKQLSGNFALFYVAFFKAMSDGWKLVPSLRHAVNKSAEKFIQSLEPPSHFVYYLVTLNNMTNGDECSKNVFVECFLRPFLTCPMDYSIAGRLTQLNINGFIDQIKASPEFARMMGGILQAELIYTPYVAENLDQDREVVLTVIGANHSNFSVLPTLNTVAKATPVDLLAIQKSQWMIPAGKTKNGNSLFLIRCSRIPEVDPAAVAANFELQIQGATNIELVIFVDIVMPYVKAGFQAFIDALPEGIIDRIAKIYVTQVNILALAEVAKLNAEKLGEKIVGAQDVSKFFESDPEVILPEWALPYEKRVYSYTDVITPKGATNTLMLCQSQFVLKAPPASDTPKVFGVPIATYLEIPFNILTSITLEGDSLFIRYKLATGAMALKLKTSCGQQIINAYNILKRYAEYEPPCIPAEVEMRTASSIRAESASLALHLLALQSNYFLTPALQLFETAVRNAFFSPDTIIPAGPLSTYASLFKELDREMLTNDVASRVAQYMSNASPSSCIALLPLLTKYLNSETNIEKVAKAISSVISVSNGEIVLSGINQYLWSKIESKLAIRIASILLIRSEIPGEAVGCVLREFVEKDPAFMGDLVINVILDGTVRRNSFNSGIKTSRIFAAIRTLAFQKKEFFDSRFAPLVFGCIFGAVHSDQKVVDDIKVILASTCDTLARTNPEIATGLLLQSQTIANLLTHHREMSVSELVSAGDELCGKLNEQERQRYRGYITADQGENPSTWYIKAAAMVQMGNGNPAFVSRFVDLMPSLFELEPGHLRLELCFNTLSELIPKVDPKSLTPIVLVWPALFSISHPNNHLRVAALKLLKVCVDFAYQNGGFKNIGGIESSSYISSTLVEALGAFRESFGGDLSASFIYLLVCALRRGFEDAESRPYAIEVVKACVNALKERQFFATHFLMPLIAFTNEDVVSLAQQFSQKKTPSEVIFENFDQRREVDQMFIVAYLENCVADRFCQANTQKISDCLIYGASRYPSFFRPVMTRVVEKCWRMIDVPSLSIDELDVYATLSANFLSIPDTGVDFSEELAKFQFARVNDVLLTKIIKKALTGVERAVKLLS
jgi:hypothetical protein